MNDALLGALWVAALLHHRKTKSTDKLQRWYESQWILDVSIALGNPPIPLMARHALIGANAR